MKTMSQNYPKLSALLTQHKRNMQNLRREPFNANNTSYTLGINLSIIAILEELIIFPGIMSPNAGEDRVIMNLPEYTRVELCELIMNRIHNKLETIRLQSQQEE